MMPVQSTARPIGEHSPEADAQVVQFPQSRTPVNEALKSLRESRGWTMYRCGKEMYACATPEERKYLPEARQLLGYWSRWEKKGIEPDGSRHDPFYKPIIARMFGTVPEKIWPPRLDSQSRASVAVEPKNFQGELQSRREFVRETMVKVQDELKYLEDSMAKLQQELNYLDAMMAVPVPGA